MKHIGVSRRTAASVIAALALGACSVPPVTFLGAAGGGGIDATDASTVVELVVSTDAVTVPEAGMSTFTVALSAPPSSPVLINIDSADDNRVGVTPTSVQLDSTNWNTPRTVMVSGREDADTEEAQSFIVEARMRQAGEDL